MLQLLVIVVVGYAGIVLTLYYAQGWLIFPGSTLPSLPGNGPLVPERLELPVDQDVRLHGVLFKAAASRDLVIGFGGNAQDAESLGQELAARYGHAHVAVFHYRGYGPSGGRPSQEAVLEDALAIHDHLTGRLNAGRTFAVGVSLGSSVAAYLSHKRPLAGIILVAPFDSIEAIARESYFWLPVGLLLRHRFPTLEFMAGNRTPVAVIAAGNDRVVRPERTRALLEKVENLVFSTTIEEATHNTLSAYPAYHEALGAALRAVAAASAEARLADPAERGR